MTTDDSATTARSVLERVRNDPERDDVVALRRLLDADDAAARRAAIEGLYITAARDPDLLAAVLEDTVETIGPYCADSDASVRADALALVGWGWRRSERATDTVVGLLATALDDETNLVRTRAIEVMRKLATDAPAAMTSAVDAVEPLLDDPGVRRAHAVAVLAAAASADSSSVAETTPKLLELFQTGMGYEGSETPSAVRAAPDTTLEKRFRSIHETSQSNHRFVRQMAGHAIVQVAVDDPDRVAQMTDELALLLADPDPQIRGTAADAFIALAHGCPDVVVPHVDALAARFGEGNVGFVQDRVCQALAATTVADPEVVATAVDEYTDLIQSLLDHDEPPVRGAAATLLALLAVDDPSVATGVRARLEELATDDVEYVADAAADTLESIR